MTLEKLQEDKKGLQEKLNEANYKTQNYAAMANRFEGAITYINQQIADIEKEKADLETKKKKEEAEKKRKAHIAAEKLKKAKLKENNKK